jgi:hypothetical protein
LDLDGYRSTTVILCSLDVTKESIIGRTPFSENLPQPLFACLTTGKGYQREVIPPFGKGR